MKVSSSKTWTCNRVGTARAIRRAVDPPRHPRGDENHIPPAGPRGPAGERSNGQPFFVGDITIEGDPVHHGGQLAKFLRIKLA
jgi:hypothetical protein